ncbi:phage tail assembly protein [Polycladidibacter hongkongensis]|uniref:phage tail assembly protein n=1 Tax=Polycladidibacter hongkongensis TaxID=1647556 RepID=UPI00082A87D8|nr:phage tail assembly protein [Pseudovibrio hongkongensis]
MTETTGVTVKLDYPVTHDGREINELSFRRMRAKDALIAEAETSEVKAGYLLFANLAGVDVAVVEELDMEDFVKVGEAVAPLLGKSGLDLMKAKAEG